MPDQRTSDAFSNVCQGSCRHRNQRLIGFLRCMAPPSLPFSLPFACPPLFPPSLPSPSCPSLFLPLPLLGESLHEVCQVSHDGLLDEFSSKMQPEVVHLAVPTRKHMKRDKSKHKNEAAPGPPHPLCPSSVPHLRRKCSMAQKKSFSPSSFLFPPSVLHLSCSSLLLPQSFTSSVSIVAPDQKFPSQYCRR